MENKVIEFPKKQSLRVRMQDKAQDRKAVLSLSIASVLFVSLFLNQWLVSREKQNDAASGSRQIASLNGETSEDVKWEHDFAKELSQRDLLESAKLAEKPTVRDELVFGFLQGKYGMKLTQGHIESLEFIDAQAGEQPMTIDQKAAFLLDYRDAFGIAFQQVSAGPKTESEEVFNLVSDKKVILGSAHFAMDDQGRVVSLKITQ